MVLIDVTEGLGQEEGAAGLAERLSDWRARGVSGEDADAAASALLSQASQIEALRKEKDEALLCQQQIAAGSAQSATVARIIIAKNEADGRAEAAETKLAEAIKVIKPFAEIAPLVETTNRRDGERVHEQRRPDGTYHVLYRSHFRAARNFLDANGEGHAQ